MTYIPKNIPLPEYRCKDKHSEDRLKELFMRLKPARWARASAEYSRVFKETYDSWSVSYQKENKANFEANTRLRKYIERCVISDNEQTRKPPVLKAA